MIVREGGSFTEYGEPDVNWPWLRRVPILASMMGWQMHQARCCLRPRSADPEATTTSRPTQTTRVEMAWWRERIALDLRTAATEKRLDSGRLRAELVRSLVDFEANAV